MRRRNVDHDVHLHHDNRSDVDEHHDDVHDNVFDLNDDLDHDDVAGGRSNAVSDIAVAVPVGQMVSVLANDNLGVPATAIVHPISMPSVHVAGCHSTRPPVCSPAHRPKSGPACSPTSFRIRPDSTLPQCSFRSSPDSAETGEKLMRRRLLALVAAVSVVVGVAAPVEAVRNGQPDNGAHPYVGLVVFYDAGGAPTHRCSGTMISSTVLLTAGHCTFGAASAQVWFNEHVTPDTGYPLTGGFTGAPVTFPYRSRRRPDTGDVGVVLLDAPPGRERVDRRIGSLDGLATSGDNRT